MHSRICISPGMFCRAQPDKFLSMAVGTPVPAAPGECRKMWKLRFFLIQCLDTSPTGQVSTNQPHPSQCSVIAELRGKAVRATVSHTITTPLLSLKNWQLQAPVCGHSPDFSALKEGMSHMPRRRLRQLPPPLQRLECHFICCRELRSSRSWLMFRVNTYLPVPRQSLPGSNPTATSWDSRAGEWEGGWVQDTSAFQTLLSQ